MKDDYTHLTDQILPVLNSIITLDQVKEKPDLTYELIKYMFLDSSVQQKFVSLCLKPGGLSIIDSLEAKRLIDIRRHCSQVIEQIVIELR